MRILFLAASLSAFLSGSFAQKTTKINLIKADSMVFRKAWGPDLRRVIGNVVFEHAGALLYCDSAYFFETTNNVNAFGRIHIKVSDTLDIFGDKLDYDGNTKLANLIGNAKMVDRQTVLSTDRLSFDRNTGIAFYDNHANIISEENKLSSLRGYYNTNSKEFFFKDHVLLTNPKYIIKSDTMLYNTLSRVSFFKGPTRIIGKDNIIYCENGWYNTENDKSQFSKNAWLQYKEQKLSGDSLYYDRNSGIGKAFHHITLVDTAKQVVLHGNHADFYELQGHSMITDSAEAILFSSKDTLYLHADTLHGTFDSLKNFKVLNAYHKVRFYRHDLQGICDSLLYSFLDSTVSMRRTPVIWSGENQIFADSIRIWMTRQEADSMLLYNTSFIISKVREKKYNQIKGKNMTGFFHKNDLYKLKVLSNAESLYFVDEDNGKPIGVNYASSSELEIYIKDKKVQRIKYIGKPQGSMKPENFVKAPDLILRGFEWKEESRPKDRFDIFRN